MRLSAKDVVLPKKTVVGDWKIEKQIGAGGQGSVWRVRRVRGKAPPAAMKICFSDDEKARARFEREIRLLGECASEHVLAVREALPEWREHVAGQPECAYYVAELCDGTLEDARAQAESVATLLELFQQACKAVEFLHSRDRAVIHRDLKPANFLRAMEPERIVIADFGIAKEQEDPAALTETNEVVGSPYFRAPEILNGGTGDQRSDVYSMGRILEWTLTGSLPKKMSADPLPRGGQLADEACERLDAVIAQATAIDPARRFATIAELEAALPKLWLALRPEPRRLAPVGQLDASAVYVEATALARTDDWIGWRELEGAIRSAYPLQAKEWRESLESSRPRQHEDLVQATDALLGIALPRVVLALVGVNSRKRVVADQARVVEDFVEIDGWNLGGLTVAVRGPRALVYLFHHLHGALCMGNRLTADALRLARTPIDPGHGGGVAARPVWRTHDVTGWPDLLSGNCSQAWQYLLGFLDRFPVLERFFPLRRDFVAGLASYNALLSVLELASDARALIQRGHTEDVGSFDVPPMFATMGQVALRASRQRVFENAAVVQEVVKETGASPADVRTIWPGWSKSIGRAVSGVTNHRIWPGELDLGPLAIE